MPVLYTNLLIGLEQDDPKAVRALGRLRGDLVVPYQVAVEFATGAADGNVALSVTRQLAIIAAPDDPTLRAAMALARGRRAKGERNPPGDLWVAACARARSDFVVSSNARHFRAYGVPCWNWRKGGSRLPS